MILVDFQQNVIANVAVHGKDGEHKAKEEILNSLRQINHKFSGIYGSMVVCFESQHLWRRDVFPLYKARRKEERKAGTLDWSMVHKLVNELKEELKENFNFRVMDVYGAEADDIISVICQTFHEKHIIISTDRDFLPLQVNRNITQYDPKNQEYIQSNNPVNFLREKIIKGDPGDGIPNILSPHNVFVSGKRQRPIRTEKLVEWMSGDEENFTEEMKKNYLRNQQLIDYTMIPDKLRQDIIAAYNMENLKSVSKRKTLDYITENRFHQLTAVAGDF